MTATLEQLDALFLGAVDSLHDAAFAEPTALAGWTRAHVIAHVHSNAGGLRRLVSWARTGVESPMYASASARAEEIEAGARLAPAELRARVHESAAALRHELGALSPEQRQHVVVTAQGRSIQAGDVGWLRCREVGVHAVDLAANVTFDHLPEPFLRDLVDDVIAKRAAGGELARLAAWLTGRAAGADRIGPWL